MWTIFYTEHKEHVYENNDLGLQVSSLAQNTRG